MRAGIGGASGEQFDPLGQAPFPCRFVWGPEGAAMAGDRGDVVVVVDVFSFSSAVTVAASRGAAVRPAVSAEDAVARAAQAPGAVVLLGRRRPTPQGWSLSPRSLVALPQGTRLVCHSPNGARCCAGARGAATLLVGCMLNASSVARAASDMHRRLGRPVSVVACGERWTGGDTLRPCLEDEMGAGAIISAMRLPTSPEASAAARAFESLRSKAAELLWDCASGRELRARSHGDDVRFMSRIDALVAVATREARGWLCAQADANAQTGNGRH